MARDGNQMSQLRAAHPFEENGCKCKEGTAVQWLALSPPSKKVLRLILGQSVSLQSLHHLAVSAWALSRYSGFLPQSKNIRSGDQVN